MRVADFDYELPPELIAQTPALERDRSRLLIFHRASGVIEHKQFHDLPKFLKRGNVLVLNDSKVIAARLRGRNARSQGKFEILLLKETKTNEWWAMLRPGKRARVGTQIDILSLDQADSGIAAIVRAKNDEGHALLQFQGTKNVAAALPDLGEVPLPPYISRPVGNRDPADRERYQTVYAHRPGSVAAPTAGLHFTNELLEKLTAQGVLICHHTLHVGLGTFAPMKTEKIEQHSMHEERYEFSEEAARIVNEAKLDGRRVIAVGTTSVRILETLAQNRMGKIQPGNGTTNIFIYPPYQFRIVDGLLTNFHLPRSTLLMLVSAFAAPGETRGRDLLMAAYKEAIKNRYRFFSYGDAMLIVD